MARMKREIKEPSPFVRELQDLGFSEYEARTYLMLLKKQPATAYEIAKFLNLPRSNIYDALGSLTRKLSVQPVSESPTRFVAVPPELLFRQIADHTAEQCKKLSADLSELRSDEGDHDLVWSLTGEQRVQTKITEIIENAKRHVWIKAHEDMLLRYYNPLREAAARGVAVLIVLFGDDPGKFQFSGNVRVYLHEGNGVRVGNADNMLTITTDFDTALTASFLDADVATYTQSSPFVTMAETLIRHDIYMAEIFTHFGRQIDEKFGPFLLELRREYFSPGQLTQFTENISRALGYDVRARATPDIPGAEKPPS